MDGIQMFVDEGLGHSSYLVDLGNGTAAIVDPPHFPTEHLATAHTSGLAPRRTIDTHSHAGYVTGSPSLATDGEVRFIAPAASKLETAHQAVHDGPVTVMCGHGERAMTGASILTIRGHRDVTVVDGGPDTWAVSRGQPLVVGT